MGTNFYLRKKVSNKDKKELLSYLDSKYAELRKQIAANPYGLRYALDDFYYEVASDLCPYNDDIHIGKRSAGWQFLWDYHKGRYFDANLESIKKFLSNPEYEIIDEYDKVFTLEQFLNEELAGFLYEGKTGLEEGYSSHFFISDNLRFSTDEDFS